MEVLSSALKLKRSTRRLASPLLRRGRRIFLQHQRQRSTANPTARQVECGELERSTPVQVRVDRGLPGEEEDGGDEEEGY